MLNSHTLLPHCHILAISAPKHFRFKHKEEKTFIFHFQRWPAFHLENIIDLIFVSKKSTKNHQISIKQLCSYFSPQDVDIFTFSTAKNHFSPDFKKIFTNWKLVSVIPHLPSIRTVGAVVAHVISPARNWLLHPLIWKNGNSKKSGENFSGTRALRKWCLP